MKGSIRYSSGLENNIMTSTAPVKSQALHNFALSPLKWKKNHPRGGRSSATATTTTSASPNRSESPMREPPHRASPLRGGEKEGLGKGSVDCNNRPSNSLRNGVYGPNDGDVFVGKSERKAKALGLGLGLDHGDNVSCDRKESGSKILIRIPGVVQNNEEDKGEEEVEVGANERKGDDDELMGRTWNLRPRKPIKNLSSVKGGGGGGGSKGGGLGGSGQGKKDVSQKANMENGSRIKEGSDANGFQKKDKKVKFSISLTREEIEEDIFSLTGAKPTRRPKKRAKAVQKQLDNLFPGMWLGLITPDSYKVSDNYMKG